MADAPQARRPLPTGTVTFLRTDVEGSMGLARALGPTWDAINEVHLGLLREAVDRHGGVCVRTEGDAMFAAFPEAGAAVVAAIDGRRALHAQDWPENGDVRVRMGLHTGEAHLAGDDYGGFDVNRAARIASVGHGGQIIVSGTTHGLVESNLPPTSHSASSAGTCSGTSRHPSTCSR
jgi:class 3 adenylate cyclase